MYGVLSFRYCFTLNLAACIMAIGLLTTFSMQGLSQPVNVKIGGAINQYEPQEVSIAINQQNTNEILLGVNTSNFYYSKDAGLTWTHGRITSSHGVVGDPCVLAGNQNSFYYFHLVPGLSKVVAHRTASLGAAWNDGTYTGLNGSKQNDKEWAAIDYLTNTLYLSWAQFDRHGSTNPNDSSEIQFSRSTDEGATWSQPVRISEVKGDAMGGNASCHSPMPAAGIENEVYVVWWSSAGLMFDKSTDGGVSWPFSDRNVTGRHVNWLVFNIPGVQRSPGFPVICTDVGQGEHRGNIYVCWAEQRYYSSDTDIWLAVSTDRGSSWSSARKVNDSNARRHQFFPWMVVDPVTGYLYFIYYDRRNYADAQTDVYMAVSKDGGNSFLNTKISQSPFIPSSNDFIGDYNGIAAYNNVVRPVWVRVDAGQLSLWTALVDGTLAIDTAAQSIQPEDFTLSHAYPNPFNPSVTLPFTLRKPGFVVLKAYDVLGREVATLKEAYMQPGEHSVVWEAHAIAAGSYIIRLQFDGYYRAQKALYIR